MENADNQDNTEKKLKKPKAKKPMLKVEPISNFNLKLKALMKVKPPQKEH